MKQLVKFFISFLFLVAVESAYTTPPPTPFPKGDGKLTLYHLNLNEKTAVRFRKGETYSQKGLKAINHLLRCRGDGQTAPIHLTLVELVDHLQDHFGAKEVEVISGYRSPQFNNYLRRIGRGVARYSRHMKGEAIDIRLAGVSTRQLYRYALSLQVGGVGFYPGQNFIHIDVGPFRTW